MIVAWTAAGGIKPFEVRRITALPPLAMENRKYALLPPCRETAWGTPSDRTPTAPRSGYDHADLTACSGGTEQHNKADEPAEGSHRESISNAYPAAFTMSKIGKYMLTTMPPTTTPRKTIIIGSMRASSPLTAASTSSS